MVIKMEIKELTIYILLFIIAFCSIAGFLALVNPQLFYFLQNNPQLVIIGGVGFFIFITIFYIIYRGVDI